MRNEQNLDFEKIETLRHKLLNDQSTITLTDHGAGSEVLSNLNTRTIRQIASASLSKPFQCRFMHRLVNYQKPNHILELGTSLGISTAYLASGWKESKATTVDGDPAIASIARDGFEKLGLTNIRSEIYSFEDYFTTLDSYQKFDLIFLDGHHTYEAVLQNVNSLLPHTHSNTILIIDDIYWSSGMNKAWNEIINLPMVTQSVDLFAFGLIFLSTDFLQKENLRIRLSW